MKTLPNVARGHWQSYGLSQLSSQNRWNYAGRDLQGRAKMYALRYVTSQAHLITRLRNAGIEVRFQPGPRGGLWGGYYYLPED